MDQMGADKVSRKHVERKLEERREAYKEDLSREQHEHGEIRPVEAQVGTGTWKTYSDIRHPSEAYRQGWERAFGEHGSVLRGGPSDERRRSPEEVEEPDAPEPDEEEAEEVEEKPTHDEPTPEKEPE